MSSKRAATLSALFALAFGSVFAAHANPNRVPSRHFDLVNATFDSVVTLAIAPADNEEFHDIALSQPLQGGLTSMTFDVPVGGCLRDLRVTFHGGRSQLFSHVDVCRFSGLRLKS